MQYSQIFLYGLKIRLWNTLTKAKESPLFLNIWYVFKHK